jgi:Rieske Fe-S protein
MSETSRRAVLTGAAGVGAAAVLAACGGDEEPTPGTPGGGQTETPASPGPVPTTGGDPGGAGGGIAKTSDIPEGGGKIFADQGVVITQPKADDFKAFTSTCTHMQCQVASVEGGTINCTCHGSKFSIEDGSVSNGPATQPLAAKDISVDGEDIRLGLG